MESSNFTARRSVATFIALLGSQDEGPLVLRCLKFQGRGLHQIVTRDESVVIVVSGGR